MYKRRVNFVSLDSIRYTDCVCVCVCDRLPTRIDAHDAAAAGTPYHSTSLTSWTLLFAHCVLVRQFHRAIRMAHAWPLALPTPSRGNCYRSRSGGTPLDHRVRGMAREVYAGNPRMPASNVQARSASTITWHGAHVTSMSHLRPPDDRPSRPRRKPNHRARWGNV